MSRLRTSGILLIISVLLCAGGIALIIRRGYHFVGAFVWERALIMSAFVAASVGVVVLGRALSKAGSKLRPVLGVTAFLAGAISLLVAEASILLESFDLRPELGAVMVSLLFAGEAAIGVALLKSGPVASWVAWGMILWNVLWPLGFLLVGARDWYYPILHFLPLLWIGIPLAVVTAPVTKPRT